MDVGVWNESDKEEIITLSARVGKAEKRKKIKLEPGQTQVVYLKIPLKQIETWHPENPALHTITIGLEDELDTVNMDRRFSALD